MAIEADGKTFEKEVLKSKDPVLVDFWAPWCGPCRMLAPTLDELSKSGKIKVIKINVDNNQELAAQYNVSSIPTLIMFKGGRPFEGKVGILSLPQLIAWADSVKSK
jgi:thioredoxin 1